MGYYSELAIDDTYREDYSYPSPELQLKWRIEDLRTRLEDISKGKYGIIARYYAGFRYSKDDLSYTPPEYFCRESDIMDAINTPSIEIKKISSTPLDLISSKICIQ